MNVKVVAILVGTVVIVVFIPVVTSLPGAMRPRVRVKMNLVVLISTKRKKAGTRRKLTGVRRT